MLAQVRLSPPCRRTPLSVARLTLRSHGRVTLPAMFPRLDTMRDFVSLHLGAREDEFTPVRGIAGAVVSGAVLLSALSLPLYALAAGDFGHTITSATAWRAAAEGDGVAGLAAARGLKGVAAIWAFGFWLSFAWLAATAVIAMAVGFCNRREQGWSETTWMAGVGALCLVLFAVTRAGGGFAGLDWHMTFFLFGAGNDTPRSFEMLYFARVGSFAVACIGLAYVFHDLGYRLRATLEDFGLVADADEGAAPDPVRVSPHDEAEALRAPPRRATRATRPRPPPSPCSVSRKARRSATSSAPGKTACAPPIPTTAAPTRRPRA